MMRLLIGINNNYCRLKSKIIHKMFLLNDIRFNIKHNCETCFIRWPLEKS